MASSKVPIRERIRRRAGEEGVVTFDGTMAHEIAHALAAHALGCTPIHITVNAGRTLDGAVGYYPAEHRPALVGSAHEAAILLAAYIADPNKNAAIHDAVGACVALRWGIPASEALWGRRLHAIYKDAQPGDSAFVPRVAREVREIVQIYPPIRSQEAAVHALKAIRNAVRDWLDDIRPLLLWAQGDLERRLCRSSRISGYTFFKKFDKMLRNHATRGRANTAEQMFFSLKGRLAGALEQTPIVATAVSDSPGAQGYGRPVMCRGEASDATMRLS